MRHLGLKRRSAAVILAISIVFTMITGLMTFSVAAADAPAVLDIKAANWDMVQGFTGAVDKSGAVELTGATAYGNGVVYKNDVDVSKEVSFGLKFTKQQLANGNGWFAITLGKDNNSFDPENKNAKGVTFLFFKKTDAAVECKQNTGPWWDFPFAENNTVTLKKGTTGWEIYIKNSILTSAKLAASVPFTLVSDTTFTNDKAKLGIYVSDSASNPITFEVSSLTHLVNTDPPLLYKDKTYVLPTNTGYFASTSTTSYSDGCLTLGKGTILSYTGSNLTNLLAQFKMTASITGGDWVGFIIRQSDAGKPLWDQKNAYYLIIKGDGSLHFVKQSNGASAELATATMPGMSDFASKQKTIRIGAVDEKGSVRFIFDVDGVNVINQLDSSNPIATYGKMTFETYGDATAKVYTGPQGVDSNDSGVNEKLGDANSYVGGNIVNTGSFITWPKIVNGSDLVKKINDKVPTVIVDAKKIDSNNVIIDIRNAADNATVMEDVSVTPKVDGSVFAELKKVENAAKTLSLITYDIYGDIQYEWSFKSSDLKTASGFDSTVKFTSIYAEKIKKLTNGVQPFYVSCAQSGVMPGKASLSVLLDSKWAKGKNTGKLYVYSYNKATNRLTLIMENAKVDENCRIMINTSNAGTYIVTDKKLKI